MVHLQGTHCLCLEAYGQLEMMQGFEVWHFDVCLHAVNSDHSKQPVEELSMYFSPLTFYPMMQNGHVRAKPKLMHSILLLYPSVRLDFRCI